MKERAGGFNKSPMSTLQRAIIELFLTLCDCITKMPNSCFQDGRAWSGPSWLPAERTADKKLLLLAKSLLISFCIVQVPVFALEMTQSKIGKVKAPLARKELLSWSDFFFKELGAASVRPGINSTVDWLLEESISSNLKVKHAAKWLPLKLVHHSKLLPFVLLQRAVDWGALRENFPTASI